MKQMVLVLGCMAWSGSAGWAATATFNVVPDATSLSTQITVEPGAMVPYDITVIVTPADANDNNGLGAAVVDLNTSFGIVQPEGAMEINAVLSLLPDEGSPGNGNNNCAIGNICGIGGSQQILGTNVTPFANGVTAVIASGQLIAPDLEGTYFVTVNPASASILNADISMFPVSTPAGEDDLKMGGGFSVLVQVSGNGGNNGGGNNGGNNGGGNPPPSGGPCGAGVGLAMAMSCASLWLCHPRRRRWA
jgi:hypothetical protein